MKKMENLLFYVFYFIFFAALSGFTTYINVYLESKGLQGSQLGQITAAGLLISVFFVPLWGIIADKSKKYKLLLLVSLGASIIALYFYSKQTVYIGLIICAIILDLVRSGAMPMADVLSMNYCNKNNKNYGSIRSMGSLGWVIGSVIVGMIADAIGLDGALFGTYGGLLIISFFIAFAFPSNDNEESDKKEEKKDEPKVSIMEVFKNKDFMFILFLSLMTTILIDSCAAYNGNHIMNTLGGNNKLISMYTVATALPEVLFLAVALKYYEKYGFKTMYLVSAICIFIRFMVYAFVPSVYAFLFISILHCVSTACATVGNLQFIKSSVSPVVFATSVTTLNACVSLGRAIYSYLFGMVYEQFGSYTIYRIGAIIAFIAILVVLKTKHFDHMKGFKITTTK